MKRYALVVFVSLIIAGCGNAGADTVTASSVAATSTEAPAEAPAATQTEAPITIVPLPETITETISATPQKQISEFSMSCPKALYGVYFELTTLENVSPTLLVGFSSAVFRNGKWKCLVMVGSNQTPLNDVVIVVAENVQKLKLLEAIDADGNAIDIASIIVNKQ